MKILLGEESKELNNILSILKKRYDDIEVATDGASVLEKVNTSRPNLLIIDEVLPELDGYQICYLLRSSEKYLNLPIILIETELKEKPVFFEKNLIDGKIKKPFNEEAIFSLIDEILKKKGISDEAQSEIARLSLELSKKEKEIKELKSLHEKLKVSKEAFLQINNLLNKQIKEITLAHKINLSFSNSFMDISQTNELFFDIIKKEAFHIDGCFSLILNKEEIRLFVKTETLFSENSYEELYNAIQKVFPSFEREKVRVVKGGIFTTQSQIESPYSFIISSFTLEEKDIRIIIAICRQKPFLEEETTFFEKIVEYGRVGFSHAIFFEELERTFLNITISLIESLEGKQKYQAGHSGRVAQYAKGVCEVLGLSKEETDLIYDAALLHDIGKMNIPDEILNKPGKLTDREFAILKLHPKIGEEMLSSFKTFRNILPIICYHHERFGGGGYNGKLKGEQIPLGARILAVCDAFDAMTSDRPYRKKLSIEESFTELKEGVGTQFDPLVVKAFLKMWLEKKKEFV